MRPTTAPDFTRISVGDLIVVIASPRDLQFGKVTLPEANSEFAPENRPGPKRQLVLQPSIFRGENVSFREGTWSSRWDC